MKQIINEIENFAKMQKQNYYIGITDNLEERLTTHNVSSNFKYWNASSEANARYIEKHFLSQGMKGGSGGGKNPIYVYCYAITSYTRQ